MRKKVMALLTLFATLFALMPAAHGADLSEYQAVLDELNAQYGTSVRFPTDAEIAQYGLNPDITSVPLDEFRRNTIRGIEAALAYVPEYYPRDLDSVSPDPRLPDDAAGVDATKGYYGSKTLSDCIMYLSGTVTDSSGVWRFVDAGNAIATPTFSSGTGFSGTQASYSFIDSRRTCAVTITGLVMTENHVVIMASSRYAEFRAE